MKKTDRKLYNISFTNEIHSELKGVAAKNDTTIRDLIDSLLEFFLSEQFPPNLKDQIIFVAGRKTAQTLARSAEKRKKTLHEQAT
jgi:hypothetical protein